MSVIRKCVGPGCLLSRICWQKVHPSVRPKKSPRPHIQSQCPAVLARELEFWTASPTQRRPPRPEFICLVSVFLCIPLLVALRRIRVRNTELQVTSHGRTCWPKAKNTAIKERLDISPFLILFTDTRFSAIGRAGQDQNKSWTDLWTCEARNLCSPKGETEDA